MNKMIDAQVSPRKMRELFQVLEDQFDTPNKRYKGSASDESVSKLTGLSIAFVSKVRAEAFGEIGPDPRVAKLELELAATFDMLTSEIVRLEKQIKSEADSLRARIAQLKM